VTAPYFIGLIPRNGKLRGRDRASKPAQTGHRDESIVISLSCFRIPVRAIKRTAAAAAGVLAAIASAALPSEVSSAASAGGSLWATLVRDRLGGVVPAA
jgi:hypothetical protein